MFRKDRGMDRPSRPKSTQGGEAVPTLEPGKGNPTRRPAPTPDPDIPPAKQARAPWPRPAAGGTPNRLTALLGQPVTRPVNAPPEQQQTHSEPRRETGKRMHIGQDISISGEITTCDVLVVDGHVDATVRDCGRLEIGPAGTLRGDIEVRNAEIGGHFDGELKVADRLTVRGTGRVSGIVRYGRLEVTVGGQLRGDIAPADPEQAAAIDEAAPVAAKTERPESLSRPSAASILKPNEPADTPDGSPEQAPDETPKAAAQAPAGDGVRPQDAKTEPDSDGPDAPEPRTISDSLNRSAAE